MSFLWAQAQLVATAADVGSLVMSPILVSLAKHSRCWICAGMLGLMGLKALG